MPSIDSMTPAMQADPVLEDLLEKKRRKQIRSYLDAWARCCGWEPALHHRIINGVLERVEAGELKKVMVFLPPGSAKSTYTSVQFPPWYLSRRPGRQILACSHRDDLVQSFGRKGRELINQHSKTLGIKLTKHSQAADRWEVTNGGIYQGAGVSAGIAGIRADLGLIDDFFGKKEDADSKLLRDKMWDWYQWDFMRRLKPGAAQIIINTRWNEDDLPGRLLLRERDEWLVIDIPLYAKENDILGRKKGDPLWPEYFDAEFRREAEKDPDILNCAFQNDPTPAHGNYFQRDWIQEYRPDQLPTNLRYYACSDHALSKRNEADKCCFIVVGVDTNDNIWVLPDIIWDRIATDVQVEEMLRLNKQYKPITWWAGKEHITGSIAPFLNKRMVEEKNYICMEETPSTKDLMARAQPLKGRMKQRKVFFPLFWDKWHEAKHELLAFPKGAHDDFVAALSEVGRGLDDMMTAKPTPVAEAEHDANKPWVPTIQWMKDSDKRKQYATRVANMDN